MRFRPYVCTSPEASFTFDKQGCLYSGAWRPDPKPDPCINCGVTFQDSRTIWYKISMLPPYWMRRPFRHPHKDIYRWCRYFIQRRLRGYDDQDLWQLDYTIAKFIAPRLRAYIEQYGDAGIPSMLGFEGTEEERSKQWKEILEKMHRTFQVRVDEYDSIDYDFELGEKQMKEGMELFAKYWRCLWD